MQYHVVSFILPSLCQRQDLACLLGLQSLLFLPCQLKLSSHQMP